MDKWERRAKKLDKKRKAMPIHGKDQGELYKRAIEKKVEKIRKRERSEDEDNEEAV